MTYRVLYSQTSREEIKSLHPSIKSLIKTNIQKLKGNPFLGKALEKELSGYHSLSSKRFRIIYKINHRTRIIQMHYIGHRKDVYELFKEHFEKD